LFSYREGLSYTAIKTLNAQLGIKDTLQLIAMKKYDVIIVGAGPAGSTTARYIDPRRSGISVLMIESRRQVGLPIQCGEALPHYRDVKMVFPCVDCPEVFDLPAHVIASEIHGIKFVLPRGKNYFADVTGRMFYRDRLDQYLFAQAAAAGADYRLHARVNKIEGHRIFTATETFEGNIIVGADGPNSTVSASFQAFSPNRDLTPCAFVIAEGDFFEQHIELWVDQRFPGGYFWLFNKNGEANIGVGLRGQRNARGVLNTVLKELSSQRQFKIKMQGGGVVPLGGLKKRVAWQHVALVGDAAGMVFPSNGGGTAQAMLGGYLLGETIRARAPLATYQHRVDEIMRPALKKSLRARQLIDLTRRHESWFLALMRLYDWRGWESFIVG
jgi:digeranylgeranylglycerophospholipid reductase